MLDFLELSVQCIFTRSSLQIEPSSLNAGKIHKIHTVVCRPFYLQSGGAFALRSAVGGLENTFPGLSYRLKIFFHMRRCANTLVCVCGTGNEQNGNSLLWHSYTDRQLFRRCYISV